MKYILLFVGLVLGFILGVLLNDIPYLRITPDVRSGEIGNFIIAIVIAIIVPFTIVTYKDKKKQTKALLIDEIQTCLLAISAIKQKIYDCCLCGKTVIADKTEINMLFTESDIRFDSLQSQIKLAFPKDSERLINPIKEVYLGYWTEVTGGDLMNKNYKIDKTFYKLQNKAFIQLEGEFKKAVHKITNI